MIFKWIFQFEEKILFPISITLFLLSASITFYEAVQRNLLNHSFDWANEVGVYCMIWSIMLMIAHAGKCGHHLRIQLITNLLSEKTKRYVYICAHVFSLIFAVLILYSSILVVHHAFVSNQSSLTTLQLPIWAVMSIMIIASILLILYYLELIYRGIKNQPIESIESDKEIKELI
ncbi:hypothetical protein DH09_19650 [Bacillaceae bacterium JMAK1]|nr:hypothetical protein DH09_19650 [Bacillaceae bacterium JMAK1]